MTLVRPFRGLRYNPAHVPDLGRVVIQSSVGVSPELLHPYSLAHLTLNDGPDPLSRSGDLYRQWRRAQVLARDPEPAIYVYRQAFTRSDGRTATRQVLIAALELQPGLHASASEEDTPDAVSGALATMQAVGASLQPALLLYPDGHLNKLLSALLGDREPALEFSDLVVSPLRQQLWVLSDREGIQAVASVLAARGSLLLAGGDCQYAAALRYQAEQRRKHPGGPPHRPYDFCLAALVSLDDPGLALLPAFGLVQTYYDLGADELLNRADDYFEVYPVSDRSALEMALQNTPPERSAFGFVAGDRQFYWLLKSPAAMDELAPQHHAAWRALDVNVLQTLVLERLMGLPVAAVSHPSILRYEHAAEPAYAALAAGRAQFLFLLNAARSTQLQACLAAGEAVPAPCTAVEPPMTCGLVLYPFD